MNKINIRGLEGGTPALSYEPTQIVLIPTSAIDIDYLVRDRLLLEEEEMISLMASLAERGQQMPIEVARIEGDEARYGLISGWRRIHALQRLEAETRDSRFTHVKALIVEPENAQDAYRAMIEENEIRVNLSHYERARIALRAVEEGVYPDRRAALSGLYSAATRSKRSKIGTFMALVERLDSVLQHPTAISERLGLGIAREMTRDPHFADRIASRLRKFASRSAAEETRYLAKAVAKAELANAARSNWQDAPISPPPITDDIGGVTLCFAPAKGRVRIHGTNVDERFYSDLKAWITARLG